MKVSTPAVSICLLVIFAGACRASPSVAPAADKPPSPSPEAQATPATPVAEPIDTISAPSQTPGVGATATEAEFDFTGLADQWLTYRNDSYGFSFEYPAVYAEGPYSFCDLREVPTEDGATITIGMRSELNVFDAQGQTIEEYVDSRIQELQSGDPDWQLETRESSSQAGVDAISIVYRFGSLSRIGDAKVFKRGEDLYIFNFTFGAFCDVPEIGLHEWDVYPRMISSFTWVDE